MSFSHSIFSMYIIMTTLQYALAFDFIGWTIFGLIWILFPGSFLGIEFGEKNYDWVTIHMAQAF